MALPGFKPLLAGIVFFTFVAWVFVIIATAVTDWSKGAWTDYGCWRVCTNIGPERCMDWTTTGNPQIKDCEGALIATQAFSVLSIIFTTVTLFLAVAMLVKTALIKKTNLLILLCMVSITNLWLFLGWVMYLGVEARGHCVYQDYETHLGSSWFLQLFAWIVSLITIVLAILALLQWKKTPRHLGTAAFVPGPSPYAAAAMYPQGGYPYPYPVASAYESAAYKTPAYPYVPTAIPPYPTVSYPTVGAYGPTPNVSPYVPTPYW